MLTPEVSQKFQFFSELAFFFGIRSSFMYFEGGFRTQSHKQRWTMKDPRNHDKSTEEEIQGQDGQLPGHSGFLNSEVSSDSTCNIAFSLYPHWRSPLNRILNQWHFTEPVF